MTETKHREYDLPCIIKAYLGHISTLNKYLSEQRENIEHLTYLTHM